MLRILFSFKGRIGRLNYLLGVFGQLAILMGVFFAFGTAMLSIIGMGAFATPPGAEGLSGTQEAMASGIGVSSLIFIILLSGLSLYMGLAVQVKRLHDLNLSGWFTLINFVAMPAASMLLAIDPGNGPIAMLVMLVPLGLGLACLFFPGTRGANKYGTDQISIYDAPDRGSETWADRAQAHREQLRADSEASRGGRSEGGESGEGSERPRRERKKAPPRDNGRGGFGKRGMA